MNKILVADDNEQNRYLVSFLLERVGFVVIQARNGQEAVELVNKDSPDVVLMDIQMPVMDGFSACARVKAVFPDLPVVALTARAMRGDKEDILAAGFDGYLDKPIDPVNFHERVSEYLVVESPEA